MFCARERFAARQTMRFDSCESAEGMNGTQTLTSSSTGSGSESWATDFLETDFLGVAVVLFLGAALFFSVAGFSTLTSVS